MGVFIGSAWRRRRRENPLVRGALAGIVEEYSNHQRNHAPGREDEAMPLTGTSESPLHGYRGDPEPAARPAFPAGLSIAISREAGARGGSIARRAGVKLGWQVYSQDLIEYVAQEGSFRQDVLDHLNDGAAEWVEAELRRRHDDGLVRDNPTLLNLARMLLSLGAQGEVVLVGRGAGCLLPSRSTLYVRLVAPLAARVAYMSQWLRLGAEEAAEQVRTRDRRREEFLRTHFHRDPTDVHQYDLVLNTATLGEERCAELIVHAARAKHALLLGEPR